VTHMQSHDHHDRAAGHDHRNHAHDQSGHAHHATGDAPPFSLMRVSAWQRLIGALLVSACLWIAIWGAMA
jgi:hypothetical protein